MAFWKVSFTLLSPLLKHTTHLSLVGLHKHSASTDECQWVPFFPHGGIQFRPFALCTSIPDTTVWDCHSAAIYPTATKCDGICVGRFNLYCCAPKSTPDVMGQHHITGGITFRTALRLTPKLSRHQQTTILAWRQVSSKQHLCPRQLLCLQHRKLLALQLQHLVGGEEFCTGLKGAKWRVWEMQWEIWKKKNTRHKDQQKLREEQVPFPPIRRHPWCCCNKGKHPGVPPHTTAVMSSYSFSHHWPQDGDCHADSSVLSCSHLNAALQEASSSTTWATSSEVPCSVCRALMLPYSVHFKSLVYKRKKKKSL